DFDQRDRTAQEISDDINAKLGSISEGFAVTFMPPPVFGLGAGSGYSLYVQDRRGAGYGPLQTTTDELALALSQAPGMYVPFSSDQRDVPQPVGGVDRRQAKVQG